MGAEGVDEASTLDEIDEGKLMTWSERISCSLLPVY